MYIPMTISGLTMDPATNSPILILKEVEGEQTLPIWIGLLEATAIASELEGVKFARPMTHDLLIHLLDLLEGEILKVEVSELRNNTYYALIHIRKGDAIVAVDARPSDAIALSLRAKAPIFVSDEVLRQSAQSTPRNQAHDTSDRGRQWQDILESLSPDDFGKYKM